MHIKRRKKSNSMLTFFDIVIWLGTIVIFISLVISFYLHYESKGNIFLFFFILPLLSFLISINTILYKYFNCYSLSEQYFIQKILFILQFVFWSLFFLSILTNYKLILKIFFALFLTAIILTMFYNNIYAPKFYSYAIINLGITFFCIIYLNNLFKIRPDLNLIKTSSFWIVSGAFFYSSITFPFYFSHSFIQHLFSKNAASNIFSSSNISIIIMHIIFIKAYLCQNRQRKMF